MLVVMGESDVLAMVPRMPDVYDEPFADSSQLPTCMVMQLAPPERTSSTALVVLNGGGVNHWTTSAGSVQQRQSFRAVH